MPPTAPTNPNLTQILKLEVPVIVRMGERKMSVRDVVALMPGAIIELPKNADADLDLLVGNKQIGCGQAVKVGENFGIRLTFVGDISRHLESSLDPSPTPENIDQSADSLAQAMLDATLNPTH